MQPATAQSHCRYEEYSGQRQKLQQCGERLNAAGGARARAVECGQTPDGEQGEHGGQHAVARDDREQSAQVTDTADGDGGIADNDGQPVRPSDGKSRVRARMPIQYRRMGHPLPVKRVPFWRRQKLGRECRRWLPAIQKQHSSRKERAMKAAETRLSRSCCLPPAPYTSKNRVLCRRLSEPCCFLPQVLFGVGTPGVTVQYVDYADFFELSGR